MHDSILYHFSSFLSFLPSAFSLLEPLSQWELDLGGTCAVTSNSDAKTTADSDVQQGVVVSAVASDGSAFGSTNENPVPKLDSSPPPSATLASSVTPHAECAEGETEQSPRPWTPGARPSEVAIVDLEERSGAGDEMEW